MRHPVDRYLFLQFVAMGAAFLLGIFAIVNSETGIYILLMFYSLAASLLFEGLAHWHRRKNTQCYSQIARALMIVIFVTIFFI